MHTQIHEKMFYQFIKCPSWVYFDVHAGKRQHEALMDRLINDGLLPEKEREVLKEKIDLVEVKAEDVEDAYLQTLLFMKEGKQTIYRGVLIHKHYVGHPDVLEKVEGNSVFGNYYYVAADIKRAFRLKDEYKFQGCFYADLLERVQGVRPVKGYVITAKGDVMAYMIDSFEAEYHLTLDGIERIVAGKEPAHFLTSGCKQSPWYHECRNISQSCNDLSILNRVWRAEVGALENAGVDTLFKLAKLSVPELMRLAPSLDQDRLEELRDKALAIEDNKFIIRRRAELPEAKVELYFDIESDPLRDFDYLFGVLEVSENGKKYHSFLARKPEDEEKMWREFVAFIESHMDAPVYHYGDFERFVIENFVKKYGASEMAQEAFQHNMIDLLVVTRDTVIFPLSFYSLKDIAAYIGFSWRAEDASGAESVMWFEKWLATHDDSLLTKILNYNEDDTLATLALKRWLREHSV